MTGITHAYCWASGQIEFGPSILPGTIGFAHGDDAALRQVVGVAARHAHDNATLLVPGVPEAETEEEAFRALARWAAWLGKRGSAEFEVRIDLGPVPAVDPHHLAARTRFAQGRRAPL